MHPNKPPLPFESLVVYLNVEVPVWLSYSELTVIVTGDKAHATDTVGLVGSASTASSTPSPSASTPDVLESLGSESTASSTPSPSASNPLTEGFPGAVSVLSGTPSPSESVVDGVGISMIIVDPGGHVTVSPFVKVVTVPSDKIKTPSFSAVIVIVS